MPVPPIFNLPMLMTKHRNIIFILFLTSLVFFIVSSIRYPINDFYFSIVPFIFLIIPSIVLTRTKLKEIGYYILLAPSIWLIICGLNYYINSPYLGQVTINKVSQGKGYSQNLSVSINNQKYTLNARNYQSNTSSLKLSKGFLGLVFGEYSK